MADSVERTIYKLEIDGSAYIKGADALAESTKKFSDAQTEANKRLKENEAQLKKQEEQVAKARKALEDYTGKDAKYKSQLEATLRAEQAGYAKVAEAVASVRKGYEAAKKAAEDFASTSQKATNIAGGGRVPVPGSPTTAPPVIPPIIPPQVFNDFDLTEILAASTVEFDKLRAAIAAAETALSGLDQEGEEFKQLAPIVEKGKEALRLYDEAAKKVTGSSVSLRTQIRQGRDELVRLEEAGLGASKQYIELEKRVASLTDQFGDQQERIRVLASDTRLLDFGKAAITSATSAFQIYTSVSILAGNESEELQKKTMQLFAAMQLLTSLEQLANQVKRGGVLITNLQSAAQATYTAVVGASTGALRVFRLALLATGIGAAVAVIGLLVAKYIQLRNATREAGAQQRLLKEINDKAIDSYAEEVTQIDIIRRKLNDLSVPQKDRVAFAKEYNKTADEGNKIDLKQIDNIDLLNSAITRQIAKIKERALAQAAANVTTEKATALFKAQAELADELPDFVLDLDNIDKQLSDAEDKVRANMRTRKRDFDRELKDLSLVRILRDIRDANLEFTRSANLTAGLTKEPTKETKTAREKAVIENEFARKKAELDARLAELTRQEADNESKIRIEFAARLAKEQLEIERLQKEKKLTPAQAKILKAENVQINDLELNKALSDFNKKVTDARKKLNDELLDLQNQNIQDQLNLIQDEFDRRAALIDFNEKRELADSKRATQDRLDSLELQRLLIGEQNYQDAKASIISNGELEALNIIRAAANQRKDLAADLFKKSLDSLNAIFSEQLLQLDEITASKLQAEKKLFEAGAINYDEYQKKITKILADQKAQRDRLRLAELNTELAAINKRLAATTDLEEKEELKARQRRVRGQIADINSEKAEDPNQKEVESVQSYVEAIGGLTESIISFWQKANQAESEALDKSIALQEKRVSAAQRIAERGNAQYLKQEEDRLKELTIQRENAARRELAINAALQASQLLVGVTGAISKIATPGIGIAETIGAIATIFAALATGYGLVKSLQGNQPRLAEGTKYLNRGKHRPGKDTIPAWLNEGEAVIPTDKNKAYHPTVAAIYDGTIPAEHLNNFVKTYHNVKAVPRPDYGRIKEAADVHISSDGKMAYLLSEQNRKIDENNDLQRQTLRALKSMGVNVNMDKNGIAVSVLEAVEQINIDKRV